MISLKDKIKFYGVKKSPCKIKPSELKSGIKIEGEHTPDKKIAKAIAIAHICEFPTYYSQGLIQMEGRLKKLNKLKGGK